MEDFGKYEQMASAGDSPEEVYLAAEADGVRYLLLVIRKLFNLSLPQARKVVEAADVLRFQRKVDAYRKLVQAGHSAQEIYFTARAQGVKVIECIRLIRVLFDLSLGDAKEISIIAQGLGTSLSDYQEKYIVPALERALHILEQEEQGKLFSEITWNGQVVGHALLDLDWPFYHGEWMPLESEVMRHFLEAAQSCEGASIEFGETRTWGVVYEDPTASGQIEIRLR